jgi:hypothetical protein
MAFAFAAWLSAASDPKGRTMPALTIEVPTDQRDDLLRVLLSLYAVSADALHHACNEYVRNERALDPLLAHRAELAAIDGLLDQVGWRLGIAREPARLVGEPQLLSEVARGALDTAVDELSEQISEAGPSAADVDAIGRALRHVRALLRLLEAVHAPE